MSIIYSIRNVKDEWNRFQNNEIVNFYKFWDLIIFKVGMRRILVHPYILIFLLPASLHLLSYLITIKK